MPDHYSSGVLPAAALRIESDVGSVGWNDRNKFVMESMAVMDFPHRRYLCRAYFNQYSCLHRQFIGSCFHALYAVSCNLKHFYFYFFPLCLRKYSGCVWGSERCQNAGELHTVLCLNASCIDTDEGLKLLLTCCFHCADCVDTLLLLKPQHTHTPPAQASLIMLPD